MRDYAEQIDSIRRCAESDDPVYECCFEDCNQHHGRRDNMCRQKIMMDAADAIEELLAAVPKQGEWEHQELAPTNWTFCSVCGRQRSKKYKWYYCPSCGAKMEVSEDA